MRRARGAACCIEGATLLLAIPVALVLTITGDDWGPYMLGFCVLYLFTFIGPVRRLLLDDEQSRDDS